MTSRSSPARSLAQDAPRTVREDRWEQWRVTLERFLGLEGRMPQRRERFEGAGLGEWVYDQYRMYASGTLPARRRTALEAIPGFTWQRPEPMVRPVARRARGDRAATTRPLRELVNDDEALARRDRAPAIPLLAPDPDRGLVLLVDLGYRSPRSAFTLVCSRSHRFIDLAAAIDRVYARDDEHLAAFLLPASRRLRRESFPPTSSGEAATLREIRLPWGYWDLAEKATIDDDDLFRYVDWVDPGIDHHACTRLVSELLAVGDALVYLFDFGDKWTSAVRVLRSTGREEDAQTSGAPLPLLTVLPLDPPPAQYTGETAPGWEYYLGLDLLDLPERNNGPQRA